MVNRFADLMFLSKLDPPLEEFIPFSSILAPGVVITKNGDLLATWRLSGVSFETLSEAQKDGILLRSFLLWLLLRRLL